MSKLNLAEKTEKNLKLVASIIGSVVVIFGAVQWAIGYAMSSVTSQLNSIELSSTRSELLLMIDNHPEDTHSIMSLAEKYFIDLKGDMYMTKVFSDWGKSQGVDITEILQVARENHKN